MEIISRARWGARHASAYRNYTAPLPAGEAWAHHSVTIAPDLVAPFDDDYAAIRTLERIGQDRFGWGISYTWLITPAGLIFEGHRVDGVGTHTADRNSRSRAICFVGNYEAQQLTEAQVRAAAWLLQHAHARGWLRTPRLNGGHRDVKATACPGRHAYAQLGRINQLAAGGPIEEDDMPNAREVADELLNTMLDMGWKRPGSTVTHKATVRTVLAWSDLRSQGTDRQIAALAGDLAGLKVAVQQLASDEALDLEAITAASEAGTRKALAEGTVNVDIDVTGPVEFAGEVK